MSEETENRYVAEAHQELATRNSQVAVLVANEAKNDMAKQISQLRDMMITQQREIELLNEKYNILITKNFSGGSTS